MAAAVFEQRALEVRLAEAQSQLARAREEQTAQAAAVQRELAATRQQYEARLVEQQQRLLGEVAAKQEGLQALQAAVQVRLIQLRLCRLSPSMQCGVTAMQGGRLALHTALLAHCAIWVQALQQSLGGGAKLDALALTKQLRTELHARYTAELEAVQARLSKEAAAEAARDAARVREAEAAAARAAQKTAAAAKALEALGAGAEMIDDMFGRELETESAAVAALEERLAVLQVCG